MVVQTENRFLPNPSPEMETETKALSCFLRTGIDMCVCMHFAVFNRVGSKNIVIYVMWVGGILVCIAN